MSTNQTTTAGRICTVTVDCYGGICGAPAVVTFADGKYAECADHAPAGTSATPMVSVGSTVRVRHCGIDKTGIVCSVRRTTASVEVPVSGGRSKIISRSIADLGQAK